MLKRFSIICGVVLAVAMVAGQASANLLLSAVRTGGADSPLDPGQEVELTVRLTVTSLPAGQPLLAWNGGDFQINSGSDSTFEAATYLLSGSGAWTAVPPQGGTSRFFTGGPAGTQFFFATGSTVDLGRIVLRAGNSQGSFSTDFSQVLMLDSGFNPIPVETSGFSYSVVPEPSSAMLVSLAASGLAFFRRRS